jgi:hypothetical protein
MASTKPWRCYEAVKTAEGLLLDPHCDHAPEQTPAQTRRRLAAELRPPAPPQRIRRMRADMRDLGRNRGEVHHRCGHDYAPDRASDPAAAVPVIR